MVGSSQFPADSRGYFTKLGDRPRFAMRRDAEPSADERADHAASAWSGAVTRGSHCPASIRAMCGSRARKVAAVGFQSSRPILERVFRCSPAR